MDPQLKSVMTSLLKDVVTGFGGILVANGYLAASSEAQFVSSTVGLLLIAASQGITYWKQRQVAPAAMIQAVNQGDNGVKVVPVDASAPMINQPLKGK